MLRTLRTFGHFVVIFQVAMCLSAQSQNSSSDTGKSSELLPSWLKLGAEERARMETLNGVSFTATDNTYLLQRLRVNVDLKPLSWLRFSFQGQDSRVFVSSVHPAPSSQYDPADLRIGYVQIGDAESGPVSFRAGRQRFDFGEGRLVADPNWSNVGRSFDGWMVTLRHQNLRVDMFGGASDKIFTDGFDTPMPGEHFYGVYASVKNWIPNASIEPYAFWKLEHNIKTELARSGDLDEKTGGLRWAGKLPQGFDYGLEAALQRGSIVDGSIRTAVMHLVGGYTLPDQRRQPRLYLEWNRGSGDQNPRDGVHGAFDTLFPSSHDKFGVADQFCWTNLVHARAGVQIKIFGSVTAGAAYNSFWLANHRDGIYSGTKLLIASNGTQGTHIGQEPDIQLRWLAFRRTAMDFAFGRIFPGEFLRNTHHDFAYNSVVLGVTQRF